MNEPDTGGFRGLFEKAFAFYISRGYSARDAAILASRCWVYVMNKGDEADVSFLDESEVS